MSSQVSTNLSQASTHHSDLSHVESKEGEEVDVVGTCVDFKPGQKYATPSPGSGDRVFYETLLQQKPSSEMAQEWCLAYGILEFSEADKLYKVVCKRKGKSTTPIKKEKKEEKKVKKVSATSTRRKKSKLSEEMDDESDEDDDDEDNEEDDNEEEE